MSALSEKDVDDLRHTAVIIRADEYDGRDLSLSQDRLIATVKRIVSEHDTRNAKPAP